jgi:uncharacterized protein (TIGR03435 family)
LTNRAQAFLLAALVAPAAPQITARQSPAPAFDAASIKLNTAFTGGRKGGGPAGPGGVGLLLFTPGRIAGTAVMARQIVLEAYGMKGYQFMGGPGWLSSDRYDIEGKAAGPADEEQLRQMLRTLLAERFHLAVHREPREMPLCLLTAGKNATRLVAHKEGDPPPKPPVLGPTRHMFVVLSMPNLADLLSRSPWVDRPVLDKTGIQGRYVFAVEWENEEDLLPRLEEKFGLKFEFQKAAIDMLVIDRVERPEAN